MPLSSRKAILLLSSYFPAAAAAANTVGRPVVASVQLSLVSVVQSFVF